MRELLATVTAKGQVTIPADVRRVLGVSAHDKIVFVMDDNEVRLLRRGSIVSQTAGALRSTEPSLTAEELRAAGEKAMSEATLERTHR